MNAKISVILPTYNPDLLIINETLNALKLQTLNSESWELIIIDNNSDNGALNSVDLSWHINSAIIKENRQGLTYSRICGFNHAKGDVIVMVDDDNILAPGYLQMVLTHFNENERLGSAAGKIEGKFNGYVPHEWTKQFWGILAIRNLGNQPIISNPGLLNNYPDFAPVGAGMAVRKALLDNYSKAVINQITVITDRTGNSLSSGGDNEININILQQGYSVAYFPDLFLQHIIPPSRLTAGYLSRLNYESSKSWVKLLLKYNICPWDKIPGRTVTLRKVKAWFTFKAWLSQINYIKWKGACGIFDGLAYK
jgi:glycosyltransferase involved in cell wall biosynthesis